MKIRKLLVAGTLCASVLLTPALGSAAVIVDTGPGGAGGGLSLYEDQWMAFQFSVAAPTVIGTAQGWIDTTDAGTGTAVLYPDAGDVPIPAQLFSATFSTASFSGGAWYGPTGLTWAVTPGTYWLAFEVRTGQTLDGNMPSPSPFPLANEAFYTSSNGSYVGNDNINAGIRILSIAAIPEPSTYALMLGGLGLVAFVANRRRKSQAAVVA